MSQPSEWYAEELCMELARQGYTLERAFDFVLNRLVELTDAELVEESVLPLLLYSAPPPMDDEEG